MARGNFGERLKRERDMREVSMEELSKATRISSRFLQALENEDWERLPGGIFGHGFVRSIARYLGLNEEALLSEYDLARSETLAPSVSRTEERIPSPPKWIPAAAVVLFLILVVGLFFVGRYGWRRFTAHRAAKQTVKSAMGSQFDPASGSISSDPPGEYSADVPLDLSLSISAATRVRIPADDKLLFESVLPGNRTLHFTGNQRLEVSAADPSAVLLELNG